MRTPPIMSSDGGGGGNILATLKVPILKWAAKYNVRDDLFGDVVSGITVFILLVPQGIAYSLLAEMPPAYGLYTSTVPLLVYAVFGTSKHISMGPFAITCLLIGNTTAQYGFNINSREQAALVRTITLLHSVITLLMGSFRLGLISSFLSHSVLTGFVTGSASLIVLNQIKYLLGIRVPRFAYTVQTIGYLLTHLGECNWISIVISVFSICLLDAAKRYKQSNKERISKSTLLKLLFNACSLMCIVAGSLASFLTSGHNNDLQVVGYVPPGFMIPSVEISPSLSTIISLVPSSFTISIISFAGCLAIARKFSEQHRYDIDATQELLAQGLSSLIGLLLVNSFVPSGGLARSAVNAESGANSQLSGIITATLMIVSLLTITSLFYYIPMAVLGSVIIISVSSMTDFGAMCDAWRIDTYDFAVMTVTCITTFFIGITPGVLLGTALSMIFVLRVSAFPQIVHIGRLEGDYRHRDVFRDSVRNADCRQIPGVAILRMDAPLWFANCDHFKSTVNAAAAGRHHSNLQGQPIRMLILDVSMWGSPPDIAALHTLNDIHRDLIEQGIQLSFACARGLLRDRLSKAHFVEKIGTDFFFLTIDDAVSAAPARRDSILKELSSYGNLSSVFINSNSGVYAMAASGYKEGGKAEVHAKKHKKKKHNKMTKNTKENSTGSNNSSRNDMEVGLPI